MEREVAAERQAGLFTGVARGELVKHEERQVPAAQSRPVLAARHELAPELQAELRQLCAHLRANDRCPRRCVASRLLGSGLFAFRRMEGDS